MELSQKMIEEFKTINFKVNGIILEDYQAKELGNQLLNLFRTIYKPIQTPNDSIHYVEGKQ